MQVRRLRSRLTRLSYDDVFEEPEQPTLEALREAGFSRRMIERFFRPFLGGVFLDRELQTSSRMFYFVFRMFALGDAAVPARGMEQIPRQLVARLPEGTVRCSAPVASVTPTSVTLSGGESVSAKAVVVATEGPAAARLLGEGAAPEINTVARGVRCLYFAADESPLEEAVLVLSGEDGPVNNFCVMSEVSANYAPHGTSLMSATVLDDSIADEQLETQVRQQMTDWFGATVNLWRHLRTYRIPYGLPAQSSPALDPPGRALRLDSGIFLCGDHRDVASLQGAMLSGRRAADGVLEGLW